MRPFGPDRFEVFWRSRFYSSCVGRLQSERRRFRIEPWPEPQRQRPSLKVLADIERGYVKEEAGRAGVRGGLRLAFDFPHRPFSFEPVSPGRT